MKEKFLNDELIKVHIEEKEKLEMTDKKYTVFFDGKVLQICFFSTGCKFSKKR